MANKNQKPTPNAPKKQASTRARNAAGESYENISAVSEQIILPDPGEMLDGTQDEEEESVIAESVALPESRPAVNVMDEYFHPSDEPHASLLFAIPQRTSRIAVGYKGQIFHLYIIENTKTSANDLAFDFAVYVQLANCDLVHQLYYDFYGLPYKTFDEAVSYTITKLLDNKMSAYFDDILAQEGCKAPRRKK